MYGHIRLIIKIREVDKFFLKIFGESIKNKK